MRGGMGMSMRAERSPHGRGARSGQADLPKKKPNLKKVWPQVRALIVPRMGLLLGGMGLMVVNRVAGLVLPFMSKPLLDKVLSPHPPHPELLPRFFVWVFSEMGVKAIPSFPLTQLF